MKEEYRQKLCSSGSTPFKLGGGLLGHRLAPDPTDKCFRRPFCLHFMVPVNLGVKSQVHRVGAVYVTVYDSGAGIAKRLNC